MLQSSCKIYTFSFSDSGKFSIFFCWYLDNFLFSSYHLENYKERAFAYEEKVRPYLDQIRDHIDHLEMEVDDEIWPLPKYRELLFTK